MHKYAGMFLASTGRDCPAWSASEQVQNHLNRCATDGASIIALLNLANAAVAKSRVTARYQRPLTLTTSLLRGVASRYIGNAAEACRSAICTLALQSIRCDREFGGTDRFRFCRSQNRYGCSIADKLRQGVFPTSCADVRPQCTELRDLFARFRTPFTGLIMCSSVAAVKILLVLHTITQYMVTSACASARHFVPIVILCVIYLSCNCTSGPVSVKLCSRICIACTASLICASCICASCTPSTICTSCYCESCTLSHHL